MHRQRRNGLNGLRAIALMSLVLSWAGAQNCTADQASSVVHESEEAHPLGLELSLSGLSLSRAGTSLIGLEFGAGLGYFFNPKWSVGVGYHQSFNSLSFSAMYSAFQVGVTYAITGTMSQETRKIRLGDTEVYQERSTSLGGLRAMAVFSQYFFNGSSGIYPYSGLGVAVLYEFDWLRPVGFRVGVRGDLTQNGVSSLQIIQGVAQAVFPL